MYNIDYERSSIKMTGKKLVTSFYSALLIYAFEADPQNFTLW
jgi:hypothetical protein